MLTSDITSMFDFSFVKKQKLVCPQNLYALARDDARLRSMGNTMLTRSRHMHEKKPNNSTHYNKVWGGLVAATVASKFVATVLSFPQ